MDLSYGQPSLNPVWRSGKHKGKLPMASNQLVAKSHQCFFPFGLTVAKLHGMPRELIGRQESLGSQWVSCVEGGDGLFVKGSY